MSRFPILTLLLTAVLAGCGKPAEDAAPADPAAAVRDAIAQAEQRHQSSADMGHAWHQPSVLIEAARASLDAGDFETAMEKAERATAMAEAAIEQAEAERSAWRQRPPFAS